MTDHNIAKHYQHLADRFPHVMETLEQLGASLRVAGPIPDKTTLLIQLAGAAAIQSQGSVHSHTKRALDAGATPEEIYHTLVLLTSTIGFPKVSAAISWAEDILQAES